MKTSKERSALFGLKALKKRPELIPLVTILCTAVTGGCAFIFYSLYSKPDVRMIKSRGPPHEDVQPTEYRKLLKIQQEVKAIPELEALKKDIGSYKS